MDPWGMDFNRLTIGLQSLPAVFTVTNTDTVPSQVPLPILTPDPNQYEPNFAQEIVIRSNTCTSTLPPNGTCTIDVGFNPLPEAIWGFNDHIDKVYMTVGTASALVCGYAASGVAIGPAGPFVGGVPLDFGSTPGATRTVIVVNSTPNEQPAPQLSVKPGPTGPFSNVSSRYVDFQITNNQCNGVLAPGQSCTADVVFAPVETRWITNLVQAAPWGISTTITAYSW
jgi:hypothetical protein